MHPKGRNYWICSPDPFPATLSAHLVTLNPEPQSPNYKPECIFFQEQSLCSQSNNQVPTCVMGQHSASIMSPPSASIAASAGAGGPPAGMRVVATDAASNPDTPLLLSWRGDACTAWGREGCFIEDAAAGGSPSAESAGGGGGRSFCASAASRREASAGCSPKKRQTSLFSRCTQDVSLDGGS